MNSWFISDIHLKDVNERNGNTLLRFLFFLARNPKNHRLFLLGDIFDAWVSDGSAFVTHFKLIIDALQKLKTGGTEIYYFEGNHDFHIDVFWTKTLNIPVIEDVMYFEIDGLQIRLEHGDFINPDDHTYLKYRAWSRRPLTEWLVHTIPSRFWKWQGEYQSLQSRKRNSRYNNSEKAVALRELIRTYAVKSYSERPFDLIVSGHMHVFDDIELNVEGKKIRSINLGSWLEKPVALRIAGKQPEMLDLELFLQSQKN